MSIQPSLVGLTKYKQWIVWKPVRKPNGKIDKLPLDPRSLEVGNPHDPGTWVPYDVATELAATNGVGIGFVLTSSDPFYFVDIDNCVSAKGEWSALAVNLSRHFAGAAMLTSSSGTGMHIMGTGKPSNPRHKCRHPSGFELYTSGRFVAISQYTAVGDVEADTSEALNAFLGRYMVADDDDVQAGDWTVEAVEGYTGPTNDDELVKRALEAAGSNRAKFGGRPSFAELWTRDEDVLAEHYPAGDGVRLFDESRADATLAADLAFWTGRNCERIETLMRLSGLARDKWDSHSSYLRRTIAGACAKTSRVYDVEASVQAQAGLFDGCVFVTKGAQMYMPNGELLKEKEFNGRFAGPVFWLSEKTSTREAWKGALYTKPAAVKKVDRVAFKPRRAPGEVFEEHGIEYVNTFVPKFGARKAGDVTLLLEHIAKMLPDERDRDVFLSYLAACVQNYGHKFQWCSVLIGPEGAGKTFLQEIMEYSVGHDYCHQLDAKDVENRFTGWVPRKFLVFIEELSTGGRYSTANALKPLITNNRVPVQAKGVDQTTGDNYANYLIFSNEKDAVLKMRNDRRYAVFYTAQQSTDDLERDGMDQAYFRKLFKWRDDEGGLAAVADYLWTRPINVDVLGRAPRTSSTSEAIASSLGRPEQMILLAIDQNEPGFRDDMIDFAAAMRWLKHWNMTTSPVILKKILENVNFVKPPLIESPRARIIDSGRKLSIYVRRDSKIALISELKDLKLQWERNI